MLTPGSRRWPVTVGVALCALAAALYLSAGVAHAYLAEDDFTWLLGGLTFSWSQFDAAARSHFFRPVINLWFDALTTACGTSAGCYHLANLSVHLVNVALLFAIGLALSRRLFVAAFATLLFAALPGYAQTVVWVSAITGLMATLWFLASLAVQVDTIRRGRDTLGRHGLAVAAFALAVFSHEAAATLPFVSWLLHRWFSPRRQMPRALVAGFAGVLAVFAVTTLAANRHNYVFTEDHYRIGVHMLPHALDYLAALYIGPHTWPAYIVSLAALGALFLGDRVTRFGAAWLVLTLIPFLGFTWGNAGRYLYLPSIGFALALGGAGGMAVDRLARRWSPRTAHLVVAIAGLVLTIRFGVFATRAIRGQLEWLAATEAYARDVQAVPAPPDGVIRIPPPASPLVNADYAQPMLQWARQDPALKVIVDAR